MSSSEANPLDALCAEGIVAVVQGRYRTTRRWQAAMARSAVRLYAAGDPGEDLRVPIALALLEITGDRLPEAAVARLVEVLLPIEEAELHPVIAPPAPPKQSPAAG